LIGRIYERNGFPDAVRFFWSLHGVALTRPPSVHTDGHAPTLEEAKAQFQKSWDVWKAWAKMEEAPLPGLNSFEFARDREISKSFQQQQYRPKTDMGPVGVPTAAPRFRTIQACHMDLPAPPWQAEAR
jgi:predicted RNase H-like HicB family nuclease